MFCQTARLFAPIWGMTMLDVRDLCVSYGQHRALENVSVRVDAGEIVVILGANGAGKSTLLRAISGICEGRHSGAVEMDGQPILGLTSDKIVERGVALVPEGRGIFGDLTVGENLKLGAYSNRAREDEAANLDRVLNLFPKLAERKSQIARTMSGGEQQMVAIGRAMMSNPAILMLDEPSLGLSPLLCKELFANLTRVRKAGIGILLVEQNAKQSLAIADRGYLLENAHIVHDDAAANLMHDPAVQKAYLGAAGTAAKSPPHTPGAAAAPIAPTPRYVSHPAPRLNADQLLGSSISELVAGAARQSKMPVTSAVGTVSPPPASGSDRLRSTLLEIERAAANARAKPRQKLEKTTQFHAPPAPNAAPRDEPPVVIEIYRAPRVEVWRRRKDADEFDRF